MRTITLPKAESPRRCHTCGQAINPGDLLLYEDHDWSTTWCSESCAYMPLQPSTPEIRRPKPIGTEKRRQAKLWLTDGCPGQGDLF